MSEYLSENFSIFSVNGDAATGSLASFFDEWGWNDFLKAVAESPLFIIQGSGMTGIQCAEIANAFEVLTWASMQKDYHKAWKHDNDIKH